MPRAPRKTFPGSPLDPKGSASTGAAPGTMRTGHPKPPTFATRKQQKQWYKAQYKNGVVAKGTGVVTTYKRGRLVKSNAGAKTLSQKKVNLARRRHRINMVKKTGKGALALGTAGVSAYAFLSANPHTSAKTKHYTGMASKHYQHRANAVKIKRTMRGGGGGGRQRRDRKGRFS